MTIVSKDEEQWWTARNSLGQTGSIPVPYVIKVCSNVFISLCTNINEKTNFTSKFNIS